jgi:hypothetical protein
VEAYLAAVPEPARSTLQKVRSAIRAASPPDVAEGISYGMPAFRYNGSAFAGYAAFGDHCSYFPMSGSLVVGGVSELLPVSQGRAVGKLLENCLSFVKNEDDIIRQLCSIVEKLPTYVLRFGNAAEGASLLIQNYLQLTRPDDVLQSLPLKLS